MRPTQDLRESQKTPKKALALLGNSLWDHNKRPAAADSTLSGAVAVLSGPSLDPEAGGSGRRNEPLLG